MSIELSTWNRCRIAFSHEGQRSEDMSVRKTALIQRISAQFAQAMLIGGITGYAGWIYNDPNIPSNTLPTTFYLFAGTGAIAFGAPATYRLYRWCHINKDELSWIVDPMYSLVMASIAPLLSMSFAYEKARSIHDDIIKENRRMGELESEKYEARSAWRERCYQLAYEQREAFTVPNCTLCGSNPTNFYQAMPEEEISMVLCAPSTKQALETWQQIRSFSDRGTTGVWPCRENFFNSSDPDNSWKLYLYWELGIVPPWEVNVSVLNDGCLSVNASGTKTRFISSELCFSPGHFAPKHSTFCTTAEWDEFALNFTQNINWEEPNYTYIPIPDRVQELLYGETTNMQLFALGPIILLSSLALIARLFARNCKRLRAAPVLEMQTLTEVDESAQ